MAVTRSQLAKAKKLLAESRSLCVLTGAGISAESGIKTFRDSDGLWEEHAIEDVATPEGFSRDPKLVWSFYNARRKAADVATPNPAHLALSRLEMGFKRQRRLKPRKETSAIINSRQKLIATMTVLTQNIDGLHQQAGSQNILELHGSVWKVRCTDCGIVSTEFPLELPIPPVCEACDGLLRPDIVWFGESLDSEVVSMAEAAVRASDVFLVVGTSAVVQPAASYPFIAAKRKVPVIEVNLEPTMVSTIATVSLIGKAGEILPKIIPE
jgi:NAD-dependent deacetylase